MRVRRRFVAIVAVACLAAVLAPATAPAGASSHLSVDEEIGVLWERWDATAVTTDETPVALAAWPSAAGYFTARLVGQPGNRGLQFDGPVPVAGSEVVWWQFTGLGDECTDVQYPPRTVYPAGQDPRDCFDARIPRHAAWSGPRGLTLPLVAHEFDPDTSTGQGAPVVLHDITQEPGLEGACGVGVLGIRNTPDKHDGNALDTYRYDRAVETRYYHLEEWQGEVEDQAPLVDERQALYSERAPLVTDNTTAAVYAPAEPDITAPWVTITSPADCAQVPVGGELVAEYFCEDLRLDENGPDTLASCIGDVPAGESVDTSTPGEHTLTVTGIDNAGNERSHSVRYTVVDVAHQDGPDPEPGDTIVRALGPTGTLTTGEEGTLWAALGPKDGYPETHLLAYEPFTLRGMHLTVPLYEHELTTFPHATQVNCHGDEPTVADDGIEEQVVRCFNLAAADTVDVFLPVVATSDVAVGAPDPVEVTVTATSETVDRDGATGEFVLTRTGGTTDTLTVDYSVSGTAEPHVDYQVMGPTGPGVDHGPFGPIVFDAGEATTTLSVHPVAAGAAEDDRTVTVTVVDGDGYEAGVPAAATITILASDPEPVDPGLGDPGPPGPPDDDATDDPDSDQGSSPDDGGPGEGDSLPPTFTDIVGNVHASMIRALAGAGITAGCAPDRYCPSAQVTRGQMASFIDRAFELPATHVDYFDDDDGSVHEAAINRVAAAGIAQGTGPRRFEPGAPVTRAQMATFLAEALGLDRSGAPPFVDVDGSIHAGAIAAIAEAGITQGCSPDGQFYCPADPVRRDQMASFIGRAVDLEPVPPRTAAVSSRMNVS